MAQQKPSTTKPAAAQTTTSQGDDFPEIPENLRRSPSPSQSPSPSPNNSPPQEPNLSESGSASADAGDLGEDFTEIGAETQPEPEVLPPDLLTPEEFTRRFASWFEMPAELLSGSPSEASRDAAARALHAEIVKSGSTWFRSLASRRVGSVGNWGIVAMFAVSMIKGMADQARAAAMHQAGAPAGGNAGAPEGAQPFPNVNMGART